MEPITIDSRSNHNSPLHNGDSGLAPIAHGADAVESAPLAISDAPSQFPATSVHLDPDATYTASVAATVVAQSTSATAGVPTLTCTKPSASPGAH